MILRDANRLLLIPALIVLGSLAVSSCAFFPSDDSSTSARDRDDKDDKDEEEDEEEEVEEVDGGCPPEFISELERLEPTDFGGTYSVLDAADFGAPEIGGDLLDAGCLFRAEVEVDGAPSVSDFGYLPGDAATVTRIEEALTTAGYTAIESSGYYTNPNGMTVLVSLTDTDDTQDPSLEDLGLDYGDQFIVVMASTSIY